MLKLKKKYALLLGIFLFSVSCGSLPRNPKVEICAHIYPANQAECFDNQSQEYRTLELSQTDRYIMFSPDDWGLILLYVDALERRVRNKGVRKELRKIRETSNLLTTGVRH